MDSWIGSCYPTRPFCARYQLPWMQNEQPLGSQGPPPPNNLCFHMLMQANSCAFLLSCGTFAGEEQCVSIKQCLPFDPRLVTSEYLLHFWPSYVASLQVKNWLLLAIRFNPPTPFLRVGHLQVPQDQGSQYHPHSAKANKHCNTSQYVT